MPIELPMIWIVILNVLLWPVIQVALAWGFTRMPVCWFHPPATPRFETAALYEEFLLIKQWKNLLPDGASWIGGAFKKSQLRATDREYLHRFIMETWRGELCHGCALLFVPVFFLWNPWWGNCVILAYAMIANLPCIIAQRYTRIRLRHLLARMNRIPPHE
jgi:glycosyl-4,4'-diaponeurosporenoate acyltransferase